MRYRSVKTANGGAFRRRLGRLPAVLGAIALAAGFLWAASAGGHQKTGAEESPADTGRFLAELPTPELTAWVVEPPRPATPTASIPSLDAPHRRWLSAANRNSNPLNIKLGSKTRGYVKAGLATVSEIIPRDGGRFLRFGSPEAGFRAAVNLLRAAPYDDLAVDAALRRWSNNGYGAEIVEGTRLNSRTRVPFLGRHDLRILLTAMAAAEGYRSTRLLAEIDGALVP